MRSKLRGPLAEASFRTPGLLPLITRHSIQTIMHQALLSFNSGEITPYLAYRTDVKAHAAGAERMENFLPMPFGGVRKRPGTVHLHAFGDGVESAPRLEPFQVSTGEAYALAFTTGALMVFRRDGSVAAEITELTQRDLNGNVLPLPDTDPPVPVAFSCADPFALQCHQVNDVMFIAGPDLSPLRLSRLADEEWQLERVPFSFPPLLDENADETLTIQCSIPVVTAAAWVAAHIYAAGDQVTHGGKTYACKVGHYSALLWEPGAVPFGKLFWDLVTVDTSTPLGQSVPLVASKELFTAGHVGAVFQISKKRGLEDYEVSYEASDAHDAVAHPAERSGSLVIQGKWSILTFGTWKGTWFIERSEDRGDTWTDLRRYESDGDRNVSAEGEEEKRVLLRLRWEKSGTGSSKPRAVLSSSEAFIRGLVRITEVTDGTQAVAEVLTPVEACTTEFWAEGAFSEHQGFPAALTVHERRLIFAGTARRGDSLWMSKTDDLLDFETGTVADDGIFITLAATQQDPVRWLASQRRLYVGTAGGEWVFGSETSDDPVSPANLVVREDTRYGSARLPALAIHDSVYYIERQGRRLREMAYQIERQSYESADLTRVAEHITEGGVVQMARQNNREPVLWCVRADGVLLAFCYNRLEEVAAWSRQTTQDGAFRSVAVLRNLTDDDEVFVTVERGEAWHLEKFAAGQQAVQESGAVAGCHHVDGGVFLTGDEPVTAVAVPEHWNGVALQVLADGVAMTLTPADGSLSLPVAAQVVHAGLPVAAVLTTLGLDVQTEAGPTLFRRKRAHEILLNVWQSGGGRLQYAQEAPAVLDYSRAAEGFDVPRLHTGLMPRTLPGGHVDELSFTLLHEEPQAFTLRAAVVRWEASL